MMQMDFSTWSPSQTIFALLIAVSFIGQVAILFYRTGQLEKRIDTQDDIFDRLEAHVKNRIDRIDKRIDLVDKRIDEIIQRLTGIETALLQLNRKRINRLSHHEFNS